MIIFEDLILVTIINYHAWSVTWLNVLWPWIKLMVFFWPWWYFLTLVVFFWPWCYFSDLDGIFLTLVVVIIMLETFFQSRKVKNLESATISSIAIENHNLHEHTREYYSSFTSLSPNTRRGMLSTMNTIT